MEIDHDDDMWAYMVSRSWQTEQQAQASREEYRHYLDFIRNIFAQPLDDAVRRPFGFWPGNYERWFLERKFLHQDSRLWTRIKRVIRNPKRLAGRFIRKRTTDIDDFFSEQGDRNIDTQN